MNYICGQILPAIRFYHNDLMLYLIVLFTLFTTLANTTYRLPEDGAKAPKLLGVIVIYCNVIYIYIYTFVVINNIFIQLHTRYFAIHYAHPVLPER